MLRRVLLGIAILVIGHGVASAEPLIELEGRYWIADVSASARVKSGSVPGTDIDFKDDLGLGAESLPELRLTVFTGLNSKIRLDYTRVSFDAEKTLAKDIQFSGKTFTANTRVATELDVNYVRLGWAWQFLTIPTKVKFGPLLEAKAFLVDASLKTRGLTPSLRESQTFLIGLPTVGLALDVSPHEIINLFAEASGLPAGDFGHFVDAEAGIKLIPLKNLTISGGYRVFEIRAGASSNFARLRLFGPFVGASLRF